MLRKIMSKFFGKKSQKIEIEVVRIEIPYEEHPGTVWAREYPEAHAKGDFPRHSDDGRCALCEGWGCMACKGTGGY